MRQLLALLLIGLCPAKAADNCTSESTSAIGALYPCI